METVKDVLKFCNAAIFYDYWNIGVIEEPNCARFCIINNFLETKPVERILIYLPIMDVVILRTNDNDIENIIENIHDSRENRKYMIGLLKMMLMN